MRHAIEMQNAACDQHHAACEDHVHRRIELPQAQRIFGHVENAAFGLIPTYDCSLESGISLTRFIYTRHETGALNVEVSCVRWCCILCYKECQKSLAQRKRHQRRFAEVIASLAPIVGLWQYNSPATDFNCM